MTKKIDELYDTLDTALSEAEERRESAETEEILQYWSGYERGLREALIAIDRMVFKHDAWSEYESILMEGSDE